MATYASFYPGLGLIDEKFKSTVSPVLATSKDLVGCGGNTHTTSGYAGNYNYRIGCGSVNPLFNFAVKNLVANTTQASGVTGDHAYGSDKLIGYLNAFDDSIQASALLPGGPSPILRPNDAYGYGTPAKLVGSNWVFVSAAGDTRTFSVPRYSAIKGCEGIIIGYRISQSFTENTFDPITCTPKLAYASSFSYSKVMKNRLTGALLNYVNTGLGGTLNGTKVSPTQVLGTISGVDALTLPETAAVLWPTLGFGGTTYNVGTFA